MQTPNFKAMSLEWPLHKAEDLPGRQCLTPVTSAFQSLYSLRWYLHKGKEHSLKEGSLKEGVSVNVCVHVKEREDQKGRKCDLGCLLCRVTHGCYPS